MMNVVEESDCTEYGYKKLFNHVEVVDAWENFYDLVETSFKDQITLKFFSITLRTLTDYVLALIDHFEMIIFKCVSLLFKISEF